MSGVAIEGKVILITGANRGIGKALASKALELGAKKVYATARDESKLAEVKTLDSNGRAQLSTFALSRNALRNIPKRHSNLLSVGI